MFSQNFLIGAIALVISLSATWYSGYFDKTDQSDYKNKELTDSKSALLPPAHTKDAVGPGLQQCSTNLVNPFSGKLPDYCFGAANEPASENQVLTGHENPGEAPNLSNAVVEVSLADRVSSPISDIRRGNFNSAMTYMDLTVECRNAVSSHAETAETKSCTTQDLLLADSEFVNSLLMGVNQRDPEAEVAWSHWWVTKAMLSMENLTALQKIPANEMTDAQKNQIQELKNAFIRDMNASKEILAQTQGHNPKSEERLKDLTETGLLTAFSSSP